MIKTRINDLRIDNDYTQTQIAKMLEVARRTYAGWETNRLISIEYLIKLCKIYNVSLDYILYNSNNASPFKQKYDFDRNIMCSNITKYRKDKNLNEQELANMLHTSQSTISKWESNQIQIKIDTLKTLANTFDISIDKLVGII